jgi:hypothetical protein
MPADRSASAKRRRYAELNEQARAADEQRDIELSPAERLRKGVALSRQAVRLRNAGERARDGDR